jgi:hypothetical protein
VVDLYRVAPMAKYLRIDGTSWRLPAVADLQQIHRQLMKAASDASVVEIPLR